MLQVAGLENHREKVGKLVEITGRKPGTVSRWLNGQSKPRTYTVIKVVSALNFQLSIGWLLCGVEHGRSPVLAKFIEDASKLPDWKINKLTRMAIRLLNHDSKVYRLIEMQERGQISGYQLLNMM